MGLTRRRFVSLAAGAAATALVRPAGAQSANVWTTTGEAVSSLAAFDTAIQGVMQKWNIPGGAFALVVEGRLVFARGYGWAPSGTPAPMPTSLFRLASVSKPITATALMLLVQEGKLSLEDPITSHLTLAPPPGGSADPRLGQVTLLQTAQMTAGFPASDGTSVDPMFNDRAIAQALNVPLPVTIPEIMQWTTGQPLLSAPGTAYHYSDYGYVLLGQAIQAVSGMSYEQFVQQVVFKPIGVAGPAIGQPFQNEAYPGEVTYADGGVMRPSVYSTSGQLVPYPYGGFNIGNASSAGGWVASAVHLAKFLASYDDPPAGWLTRASIQTMLAEPSLGVDAQGFWYGVGWLATKLPNGNQIALHNGSLPGTTTIIERDITAEASWALLFNARDESNPFGSYTDALNAVRGVIAQTGPSAIPSGDLFPQLLAAPPGSR
jgi:CubicO group peptidase (beta-lactamase class C family)